MLGQAGHEACSHDGASFSQPDRSNIFEEAGDPPQDFCLSRTGDTPCCQLRRPAHSHRTRRVSHLREYLLARVVAAISQWSACDDRGMGNFRTTSTTGANQAYGHQQLVAGVEHRIAQDGADVEGPSLSSAFCRLYRFTCLCTSHRSTNTLMSGWALATKR